MWQRVKGKKIDERKQQQQQQHHQTNKRRYIKTQKKDGEFQNRDSIAKKNTHEKKNNQLANYN